MLLFLALQAQSGVFGRAEVRLRVRQVIIRLLQQALRFLLLSAELVQRGGGLLLLGLVTPIRQVTRCLALRRRSRSAASRLSDQDLPVQCDDAKAVAEFVGNGNGRVEVLPPTVRRVDQDVSAIARPRIRRARLEATPRRLSAQLDAASVQRRPWMTDSGRKTWRALSELL